MTDRLKTVYPPKTMFCGGYKTLAQFDVNEKSFGHKEP